MRIVAWNIRAGGGRRRIDIVKQIRLWNPDVVVLSEFRGTDPSLEIAQSLKESGWHHQRNTTHPHRPPVNSLLIAARSPMRVVRLRRAPNDPNRWLHVSISGQESLAILAVHVPNRVTGRKVSFLEAIADVAEHWRGPPALVVGDTNTGRIDIDEENPAFDAIEDQWMQRMDDLGWRDGFRMLHPQRREFTWYSPNGNNGFRLDQAFFDARLHQRVVAVAHRWGGDKSGRSTLLSDHAALVIDLVDP